MVKVLKGSVPRGRTWGGFLALGGALLAVPSVIWPTLRLTDERAFVPAEFRGPAFVQNVWSWGRYSFEGPGAPAETVTNVVGLVFAVAVLVTGLAASLLWLTQKGSAARLLGVAGTGAAFTEVAHGALQRAGQLWADFYGGEFGPTPQTTAAGVLEYASAVVLAAALVFMLWRPALVVGRPLWRDLSARAVLARDREDGEPPDPVRAGGVTVLGDAVIMDSTGAQLGDPAPGGTERTDDEHGVGFSDPSTDDDPFRPPNRT